MAQSVNFDALIAVDTRLKTDVDKLLAFLQSIRDQNVQLASELAALSGGDPAAVQAGIDAAVAKLTETATAVENVLPVPPPTWTTGATVAVGDKVTLSTGVVLTATASTGPTGAAEPVAPAAGATVVDGGVTWSL